MTRGNSRASSGSGSRTPNSPIRPQLRRESAQDHEDGEEGRIFKFCLSGASQPPPDLKIDLLSENSSQASYSPLKSQGSSSLLLGAPSGVSGLRRHSNNYLTSRNKSAPVTPLNRSTSNVSSASNITYTSEYVYVILICNMNSRARSKLGDL